MSELNVLAGTAKQLICAHLVSALARDACAQIKDAPGLSAVKYILSPEGGRRWRWATGAYPSAEHARAGRGGQPSVGDRIFEKLTDPETGVWPEFVAHALGLEEDTQYWRLIVQADPEAPEGFETLVDHARY